MSTKAVEVPCLVDLCISSIAKNIDTFVSHISNLPQATADRLWKQICSVGKQSGRLAHLLTPQGSPVIEFSQCSEFSDRDLILIIEKAQFGLSSLKVLRLGDVGYGLNEHSISTVTSACSEIEELSLGGCYQLSPAHMITLLRSCQRTLRHLSLSSCSNINGQVLAQISCMDLESLSLDHCDYLTDSECMCLSSSASVLRALSCSGLIHLTDMCLPSLLQKHGPCLRNLNLSGCTSLGDETLSSIRNHCALLVELDVSNLGSNISVLSIQQLFSYTEFEGANKSLEVVKVSGLNVTDEVVECISLYPKLRVLSVGGCGFLTSKSMTLLATNCPLTLQELDLSFCRGIDEQALRNFINPNLRRLVVWGCNQLSPDFTSVVHKDLDVIGLIT